MLADDIAEFIDNGICVAKDTNGKVVAIVDARYRFRLKELTKVLFGHDNCAVYLKED